MPLPGNLALVQVTGPIVDDQGNALTGVLELRSNADRVLHPNGFVVPRFRRVAVNNGSFSYGLLPSAALNIAPSYWTWHARFISSDQQVSVEFDIRVPSAGPVTIGSIANLPTPDRSVVIGAGAANPSNQGTFSVPSVGVNGSLIVTFNSNWGVSSTGTAYYNAAGATVGEAAYLSVSSAGALVLIKPKSNVTT